MMEGLPRLIVGILGPLMIALCIVLLGAGTLQSWRLTRQPQDLSQALDRLASSEGRNAGSSYWSGRP